MCIISIKLFWLGLTGTYSVSVNCEEKFETSQQQQQIDRLGDLQVRNILFRTWLEFTYPQIHHSWYALPHQTQAHPPQNFLISYQNPVAKTLVSPYPAPQLQKTTSWWFPVSNRTPLDSNNLRKITTGDVWTRYLRSVMLHLHCGFTSGSLKRTCLAK